MDRYLSGTDVFAMAIGVMVGWGAFVMPGTTFLPVAGPAGSVLAMAIGALLMLVIGASFAWLMRRSSRTGGVYAYTKEAFGRDHAFLSSWFLCLSYLTVVFLNGTALFVVVRTMMNGATVSGLHYTVAGNDIYLSEVLVSVAAFALVGLAVMMYIQNLIRRKHEVIEREKIRAVEGSMAKSQFLFNMSHDIRTPMNAIIGYTTLARKEEDPAVLHDYLGKIDTSSHHLLTLINDILEMSRIESGKIELAFVPTDLKALFDEIHDLFAEQMRQKQLDFTVHTGQVQHRYAWCDKKNMTRVLLNVVSNAYKFTPEDGTIDASLWESVASDESYGNYEIRVRDSGIGMSSAFVEKMFNAFERERTSTDSGVEGTGLGLSITKSIVDLMGGTIEVLTSPGSGTELVIRVRLKLAEEADMPREEVAEPAKPQAAEQPVDFTGMRLLLVEDNLINMEIASMILTQMGFAVETAENGQIAVDRVAASEPGYYSLVLMDIQMPVMDGYTATRTIRALEDPALAGVPIVAMTANAFAEDVQAARDAGMQAHIAKPVDIAVLHRTLQDVLRG